MIIGITGAIGSGKSTVADILRDEHGFSSIEFSEKLKMICSDLFGMFGVGAHRFHGTQEQKNEPIELLARADGSHPTGREILQHIGTEGFRAIDSDVWLRYVFSLIDTEGGDWVIPGLRFPNEAQAVWERGGEVWLVVCDGGPNAGMRTGHESDEVWRSIEIDRILAAPYGAIDVLEDFTRFALAERA